MNLLRHLPCPASRRTTASCRAASRSGSTSRFRMKRRTSHSILRYGRPALCRWLTGCDNRGRYPRKNTRYRAAFGRDVRCTENGGKLRFSPHFPPEKMRLYPLLKTCGLFIPDWRKSEGLCRAGCKKKRKNLDFLFYKRRNVRIFAQKLPGFVPADYTAYMESTFLLWKTRWKKWKT